MSWYRTYRPQTIKDLDITSVRTALSTILTSGTFAQVYLLSGPKGTGKTSAARILAKLLNCTKNKKTIEEILEKNSKFQIPNSKKTSHQSLVASHSLHEPCNECHSCIAITNGTSLAVTEIDAASNRGIDDIRALRERVGLTPADGTMSVFIIDEVHMLTTESFNALLKILEEPPAHVVFILATTDPQKIPATVISRCVQIPYRKATTGEITEKLTKIAQAERITIAEDLLSRIAISADGSLRDGVKLFEQIGSGKKTVSEEDVQAILGEQTGRMAADLLTALFEKDSATVADVFSTLVSRGMDGVAFQKEVIGLAHTRLLEYAKADTVRFEKLLELLRRISVPIEPLAPIPWMPFELACLGEGQKATGKGLQATGYSEQGAVSSQDSVARTQEEKKAVNRKQKTEKQEEKADVSNQDSVARTQDSSVDFATVQQKWQEILAKVRGKSLPTEGILRATRLIGLDGDSLCIEAAYQFHKEQLETHRNRVILEDVLKDVLESPLKIALSLRAGVQTVQATPHANVSGGVEEEGLLQAAADAFL